MKKKSFLPILIFVIFLQFATLLFLNKEKFFSRGHYGEYDVYKKAYYSSQYVQKNPSAIIPDEIFEEFAAGAFLRGMNPINIVHDHPPLGRYILSLSILIFDNAKTIVIISLIASFIDIYLISALLIKNEFLKLLPIAIYINEPLTLNKLIYAPLPEPIQLPFIIFAIYFFLLSIGKKKKLKYFIIVSLLLGFVVSIRFFVTGGVMIVSMLFFIFIIKKNIKEGLIFISTLLLALLVLILSYTRTIMDGYSLIKVLGIQKYILVYHKSAFTNPFSFWELILFNRMQTWWGARLVVPDVHWNVFWPISTVITFFGILLAFIKKIKLNDCEKLIAIFILLYSAMLSTGYTTTRYFLPLLPFLYILSASLLIKFYQFIYAAKSKK